MMASIINDGSAAPSSVKTDAKDVAKSVFASSKAPRSYPNPADEGGRKAGQPESKNHRRRDQQRTQSNHIQGSPPEPIENIEHDSICFLFRSMAAALNYRSALVDPIGDYKAGIRFYGGFPFGCELHAQGIYYKHNSEAAMLRDVR